MYFSIQTCNWNCTIARCAPLMPAIFWSSNHQYGYISSIHLYPYLVSLIYCSRRFSFCIFKLAKLSQIIEYPLIVFYKYHGTVYYFVFINISSFHVLNRYDRAATAIRREIGLHQQSEHLPAIGRLAVALVLVQLARGDTVAAEKAFKEWGNCCEAPEVINKCI